jgi:hypothetical protein
MPKRMVMETHVLSLITDEWQSSGQILSDPALDSGKGYGALRDLLKQGKIQRRAKIPRGSEYRLTIPEPIADGPVPKIEKQILLALKVSGGTRAQTIAGAIGVKTPWVRTILRRLMERELVERKRLPRTKNATSHYLWTLSAQERPDQ